jgi:tRNA(Ile)-lysidine synthase
MTSSRTIRSRFERRVQLVLGRAGLAAGAPRLLVAVSGGADSTAALLSLHRLVQRGVIAAGLSACHVDHGLRPAEERVTELGLVEALCARLGVPLIVRQVDVTAARHSHKLSWEDAARQCRYAALRSGVEHAGAEAIVTGHTADDQVETVLLRILRGTGPRGLRGMEEWSRPWGPDGPLLVRPLLSVSRTETERYCEDLCAPWCVDSSNMSPRFLRNRVRAELVPLLRSLAPGSPAALLRLSIQASTLADWLDLEAGRALAELWRPSPSGGTLLRPATPLHPYLAGAVVAMLLASLLEGSGASSERQVVAMVDLWTGPAGRRLSIRRGWLAESAQEGLTLARGEAAHRAGGSHQLTGTAST